MRRGGPVAGIGLATLVVSTLAGCGSDDGSAGATGGADPGTTGSSSPSQDRDQDRPGKTRTTGEDTDVRIQIEVDGTRWGATLADGAAAADLLAQLPVTLEMTDHGGVEKTGRLPAPLSLEGQPSGADPDVGDLGYYAPGQDLVLYYGDQSYYEGIVVLGRLDDGAAEAIAGLDGSVTATVDAG